MPIYEFACNQCNTGFERFVLSPHASKDVKCPRCGSSDVQKVMSSFSCRTGMSGPGLSSGSSLSQAPSSGGCGSRGGFS